MTRIGCADLKDLLPEWVRGELGESDRATVADHVSLCASCSAEVDLIERIRAAELSAPAALASKIKSAAAAEIKSDAGVEYGRAGRFVHWRLSAAATVVLALGTGLLWQRMQALPEVGPLGQDPFAVVWPSDDSRWASEYAGVLGAAGVPVVAGVPMLTDLSDEELVLLLEELGG